MTGTVPKPTSPHKGEKFASVRWSLHNDPYKGACIHEWAAKEVGDVADVSRWYEFNPSLGYQLLESALLADSRKMNPDTFAREHLGWWPETAVMATVISAKDWNAAHAERWRNAASLKMVSRSCSSLNLARWLAACHGSLTSLSNEKTKRRRS